MPLIVDDGDSIGALIGIVLYGLLLGALLYLTIKRKR